MMHSFMQNRAKIGRLCRQYSSDGADSVDRLDCTPVQNRQYIVVHCEMEAQYKVRGCIGNIMGKN